MKEKRTNEKNRILRLEQAGILSRKAKIKALEKNIEIGMSKIPAKDREKLRQDKARKEEAELKAAREDLWTLRGREKKVVENETSKKIHELKRNTEQIVEILERERKRKQQEKELKERQEKIKETMKEKKRLREKKVKELQEKWAMYRWVNEFITENKQEWEKTRKTREQERNEKIQEWEKKSRLEKVKTLKEKFWKEQNEKKHQEKVIESPEKKNQEWKLWRENPTQEITEGWGSNITKSPPIPLPPSPGPSQSTAQDKEVPQEQAGPAKTLAPIFKKLKSPVKLKINPETSSTGVRSEDIQNQKKITELVKETGTVQRTSSTSTEHHEPVRKNTNTKQTKITELMKETGAVQKTPSTKKKHNEPVQKK